MYIYYIYFPFSFNVKNSMFHFNFITEFICASEPEDRYSSHFYEEEDVMDSGAFEQRHHLTRSHSPAGDHGNRRNRSSRGRSYSPPNTRPHFKGYDSHSSRAVCLNTCGANPVDQCTLVSESASEKKN